MYLHYYTHVMCKHEASSETVMDCFAIITRVFTLIAKYNLSQACVPRLAIYLAHRCFAVSAYHLIRLLSIVCFDEQQLFVLHNLTDFYFIIPL